MFGVVPKVTTPAVLAVSSCIASFGFHAWQFLLPLLLASLTPNSIRIVALSGLLASACVVIFVPRLSHYVESTSRLNFITGLNLGFVFVVVVDTCGVLPMVYNQKVIPIALAVVYASECCDAIGYTLYDIAGYVSIRVLRGLTDATSYLRGTGYPRLPSSGPVVGQVAGPLFSGTLMSLCSRGSVNGKAAAFVIVMIIEIASCFIDIASIRYVYFSSRLFLERKKRGITFKLLGGQGPPTSAVAHGENGDEDRGQNYSECPEDEEMSNYYRLHNDCRPTSFTEGFWFLMKHRVRFPVIAEALSFGTCLRPECTG